MAVERTLSIIKSDTVEKNIIGEIYSRFEFNILKIVAARMIHLSQASAEGFYPIHRSRSFFNDLVKFMTSGYVTAQVLEGEDAMKKNRALIGATDPKEAKKGTIRSDYVVSVQVNSVHGSDAPETTAVEVAYFFPEINNFSQ